MIHETSGLEYQETKSKNRAKLPAGSGQLAADSKEFIISHFAFFISHSCEVF